MRQFVKDDAGYVEWLSAHPTGYVLNTYAHVTSAYVILHRASCGTVNRPLAAGRSWTFQYGKACSDDRTEIEAWALRETGKSVEPCGHCLPGERTSRRRPTDRPPVATKFGPRAPRVTNDVTFSGEPVRVTVSPSLIAGVDGPPLVIEGAQWLAETFFLRDPSAVGQLSYDAWIEETQNDPQRRDRIVDGDVSAVNRTMAARTPHKTWAAVVALSDWTWLQAVDPRWDLFDMSAADWESALVRQQLVSAFAEIRRPGLGIAVVTKVLHIKRPRLIPVLDSLVLAQVGARATGDVRTWVDALEAVRAVGLANLAQLRMIQEHLRTREIADRSLVQILDALLWAGSAGSGLFPRLTGWERIVRPRREADDH